MKPFQSLADYEEFVYTIQNQYRSVIRSTLVVARRGQTFATVSGELLFAGGYRLQIYEILTWDEGPLLLKKYSYEAWFGNNKLYWYDPQPHPDNKLLSSTAPHHKHVHPDIKHNRIPAPGMRFDGPNLPLLIEELDQFEIN